MDEDHYQLELAAFAEKIALAELEEAKAAVRCREIKFEQARFLLDWRIQAAKSQAKFQTHSGGGGVASSQGSTIQSGPSS